MPEPSDSTVQAAVAAWLRSAESELAVATKLSSFRDDPAIEPFAAAFHAQQASEKAIKALLIAQRIRFPPKHDLSLLVALLPSGAQVGIGERAVELSKYAVEQRYPASALDPLELTSATDWGDADEAIEEARAIVAGARALITLVRFGS